MSDTAAILVDFTFADYDPATDTAALNIFASGDDEGPNVPGYPSGVWAILSG